MRGNSHVRFLGEEVTARSSPYPTYWLPRPIWRIVPTPMMARHDVNRAWPLGSPLNVRLTCGPAERSLALLGVGICHVESRDHVSAQA
jgi:hypothetical protein